MIASLHGVVRSAGADWVVMDVGGVGFRVHVPGPVLEALGAIGEEATLHTHLHVKEDDITLYGFSSPEQLQLFEMLIGVSGLGPRLALAMLAALDVDQLVLAIAAGSTELLTTVPGIGKKMADRLVLELKDKVGTGLMAVPAPEMAGGNGDVLAALTSLGYSVAEASRAVAALPAGADLSLEDRVRRALQNLGASSRG